MSKKSDDYKCNFQTFLIILLIISGIMHIVIRERILKSGYIVDFIMVTFFSSLVQIISVTNFSFKLEIPIGSYYSFEF